jgi:ProP effector
MNKTWYAAAVETLAVLRERFPAAFAPQKQQWRWPLKVGIRDDIVSAAPDLEAKNIGRALRYYVSHPAYQKMMVAGKTRIDLDGKPVGVVTEAEVAHKAKPATPKSKPVAPPQKPKRLTLTDLKEAARRRATSEGARP